MSEFLLQQQTQPCPLSCVATSFAMIAGVPAEEMIELFHERYRGEAYLSIGDMLRELGIPFQSFNSADRDSIDRQGVWLVSVPSLNIRGAMHQVVVEMDDAGYWRVFDPNEGREGKLFYTEAQEAEEPAVPFAEGYAIDAYIDREALRAWRQLKAQPALTDGQPESVE